MFEHRWRRHASNHTSRFWDDYVRDRDTSPAPDSAETIRQLHQRARTPEPSATFAADLEALLMHTATDLAHWPTPTISPRSGADTRLPQPAQPPLDANPNRDNWQRVRGLLAAAVLLLAVVGGVFAGGQLWRAQRASLPPTQLPSLVAMQPATPEAAATPAAATKSDGKAGDQLWETPMGLDKVLIAPMSLALDPQGRLWVGDGAEDHFRIFSLDGELLDTWGEHGTGEGQFDFGGVGDIAFASDGAFYVADTANRRVQQFAPDRSFVRAWSNVGNGSGSLASPTAAEVLTRPNVISVAPDGSVYVTDDMNNVVEHYTADGAWLNTLGAAGGQDRLNFPGGVAFDQDGNTWVADYGRNRLAIFAPDGSYVGELTGILLPSDVSFDAAGRLIVADSKGLMVMNEALQPVGRLWRDQGAYGFVPSAASGPGDRVYAVDYNLGFLTAFQLRDPLPEPPAGAAPGQITPAS